MVDDSGGCDDTRRVLLYMGYVLPHPMFVGLWEYRSLPHLPTPLHAGYDVMMCLCPSMHFSEHVRSDLVIVACLLFVCLFVQCFLFAIHLTSLTSKTVLYLNFLSESSFVHQPKWKIPRETVLKTTPVISTRPFHSSFGCYEMLCFLFQKIAPI